MGIDEKVERNERWRRKRDKTEDLRRGGRWEAKWAFTIEKDRKY